MALARQTVNAQGGSDARYSLTGLQRGDRGFTDGRYWYDENGLSLDRPNQNVAGLVGARELNGRDPTKDPITGGSGGGGGGGGSYAIPGAGEYGQAVNMAKARYQQRLADLNKSRQGLFRQSGFKGDVNEETGLVTNLQTDPHNQYGSFQLLNRAQALRDQQGVDMNIGRGLGTGGGLAAQNMGDLRFGYGQEDAAFGSALADQLGAFTRTQQDYKYEYDAALYQAQLEALRMAIEGGDFGYGGDGGYGEEYAGDGSQTSVAQTARAALGIPPRTQPVKRKPVVKTTPGTFRGPAAKKTNSTNNRQNPVAYRPKSGGGSR